MSSFTTLTVYQELVHHTHCLPRARSQQSLFTKNLFTTLTVYQELVHNTHCLPRARSQQSLSTKSTFTTITVYQELVHNTHCLPRARSQQSIFTKSSFTTLTVYQELVHNIHCLPRARSLNSLFTKSSFTTITVYQEFVHHTHCLPRTPSDDIEEHKPVSLSTSASSQAKPKKESQRSTAASNGWFGGLWNKIALRPKNQMKLPDDKNPSIVWDSDNKRWTNLDNDQEEEAGVPPPPPKMSELPRQTVTMAPIRGVEPQVDSSLSPSSNNMYKMNKTRSLRTSYVVVLGGLRASYVDVLGGLRTSYVDVLGGLRASYVDVLGGSKVANPLVSAPDLFPTMVAPRSNINLFVPAPVERSDEVSSDFLTPSSGGGDSQDSASDPSQSEDQNSDS
uniref:Uncharacterized protein n=1 Tax=Timema cristinae TaxID=61476 RepID=A0A7R9CZF6_TIMCR|nr:unnamed protein product [Timema cristinae]